MYLPRPPRGPIFSKWLSPYCHPSSSTLHAANRGESAYDRSVDEGETNEGDEGACALTCDERSDRDGEVESEVELECDAPVTAEAAIWPSVRENVGEGGLASAGCEPSGASAAPPPPPPTGSVTDATAERRTCHSGSSQRHSVVFLRRECGSALVGEAT